MSGACLYRRSLAIRSRTHTPESASNLERVQLPPRALEHDAGADSQEINVEVAV